MRQRLDWQLGSSSTAYRLTWQHVRAAHDDGNLEQRGANELQ